MSVSPGDRERFRALIVTRFGLQFDDGRAAMLDDVLRERAQATGLGVASYLERADRMDEDESRTLSERLTITETYFFRAVEQLRAFEDLVLRSPTDPIAPLRILSAGCASGEEAYSLAIVVRETLGAWPRPVSITAADMNPAMLDKARRAVYGPWAFRATSEEIRERWFRRDGKQFALDPAIRAMVHFEELNLSREEPTFWQTGAFDVVFLRNVLMYWTPDVVRRVIDRITRSLTPGGLLFLGHAENLRGISSDYHLEHSHGCFYYRKRQPHEGARGSAPSWVPRSGEAEEPPVRHDHHDDAWVEIIRRATDRVETLESEATSTRDGRVAHVVEAPRWDLAPVMDHLAREAYAEARAHLDALPPAAASDPRVLLLRAVLLTTHGGNLGEAAAVCGELLGLDDRSAGAHYLMALCRESAGDPETSASHDRLAVQLDGTFAMPRLHLGRLARRSGRLTEARAHLSEALELLEREDAARLLLFGGGFRREVLLTLCRAELSACAGRP